MAHKKVKKSIKVPFKKRSDQSSDTSENYRDLKELADLKRQIDSLTQSVQDHAKKSPDKAGKILSDWMKSKRKKKAS